MWKYSGDRSFMMTIATPALFPGTLIRSNFLIIRKLLANTVVLFHSIMPPKSRDNEANAGAGHRGASNANHYTLAGISQLIVLSALTRRTMN